MKTGKAVDNSLNFNMIIFFTFILGAFVILTGYAFAWEKAIWPFNTPSAVSKQICSNSKGWAKDASRCYDQYTKDNLLSILHENRRNDIKEDPNYREWHLIYYGEMERYVRTVWRNPNITEDMAVDIVQDLCLSNQENIQKALEKTDPKK